MNSEWTEENGGFFRTDGALVAKGVWRKGWHGENKYGQIICSPTKYVHQMPKPKSFRSAKLAMEAVDEEYPLKKGKKTKGTLSNA